jgi:hypothetical protein
MFSPLSVAGGGENKTKVSKVMKVKGGLLKKWKRKGNGEGEREVIEGVK